MKKFIPIVLLSLFVISFNFSAVTPIRAAFFYPWFPQSWTQSGIYPYTNYHPALGYYSSSDDAVISQQVSLAKQAHLEAMIASWWGQGHHTDIAFSHIITVAPTMQWSLYYELEGQTNPTVAQIVSDLQYLNKYFVQSNYLKMGGLPVLFVYADGGDNCGMADRWAQAKAQFPNVYLVLKVFSGYRNCTNQPNSWHQYSPAVGYDVQNGYSAVVSPGFWKVGESPRLIRDTTRFTTDVQRMVASGAQWQLITTWNEWGEGTSVEPAQEFVNTYIDILCNNIPGTSSCSNAPTVTPTTTATSIPTATPTNTTVPSSTPTLTPAPTSTPIPTSTPDPVIAAAGDIACASSAVGSNTCHQKATADLLLNIPNLTAVLTLGDNQYECGASSAFSNFYNPTWGRLFALTHPSIGNHEYITNGSGCDTTGKASGYFSYFSSKAGDPTKGYYSFDIGSWHLISLNSECSHVGGCGTGSPQEVWLRNDLAAHPNACTLAYWHEPRFSSGQHGNNTAYTAFWTDLYSSKADIVLNGHDHDYERFSLQSPSGAASSMGIREFVVGTGGKNHYGFSTIRANSQVRNSDTYGVLRLTLHISSYDWKFLPEAGKTFTDSGTQSCH